jgi:hypothetical protein
VEVGLSEGEGDVVRQKFTRILCLIQTNKNAKHTFIKIRSHSHKPVLSICYNIHQIYQYQNHRMMISNKYGFIGAILGFFVFVYDYDFFLNAGGPSTPISDFILNVISLNSISFPLFMIIPGLILVLAGYITGAFWGTLINSGNK